MRTKCHCSCNVGLLSQTNGPGWSGMGQTLGLQKMCLAILRAMMLTGLGLRLVSWSKDGTQLITSNYHIKMAFGSPHRGGLCSPRAQGGCSYPLTAAA
jgi:hypothetical protein